MPVPDFETYKVADQELSSALKFGNFVQAVEDELAAIDNDNVASSAAIAQSKLAFDAWQSYVPALHGGGTNPTLGASPVQHGRYVQIGETVMGLAYIASGGAGFVNGTGTLFVTLPVAPAGVSGVHKVVGAAWMFESSPGTMYVLAAQVDQPTGKLMFRYQTGNIVTLNGGPFAWGQGDIIAVNFVYEAA